jgi:hypothetical protein
MPIRRPADLFAGKGSVAGKLKERRKKIEAGDASGGQKAGAEKDANAEAIRKKREARKAKEEAARKKRMRERKVRKAKRLRDALTTRGSQ